MISKQTIARILETAHVEEVVGEFVKLKKSGQNYKGLSPFTNERNASFYVSPAKGIYKCFSSGKGGNVVNFLMEHEHFTYPEALMYLAKIWHPGGGRRRLRRRTCRRTMNGKRCSM